MGIPPALFPEVWPTVGPLKRDSGISIEFLNCLSVASICEGNGESSQAHTAIKTLVSFDWMVDLRHCKSDSIDRLDRARVF